MASLLPDYFSQDRMKCLDFFQVTKTREMASERFTEPFCLFPGPGSQHSFTVEELHNSQTSE